MHTVEAPLTGHRGGASSWGQIPCPNSQIRVNKLGKLISILKYDSWVNKELVQTSLTRNKSASNKVLKAFFFFFTEVLLLLHNIPTSFIAQSSVPAFA